MFGFKAQRQFRSVMSLDDGSGHKNQTNKIVAITFPIISKTWSLLKLLAIQAKQFTVTLAATKNFMGPTKHRKELQGTFIATTR